MNKNNIYTLYMAYIIRVLDDFKYKVIDIVKENKDIYEKVIRAIPCDIDALTIPMTALKLFMPELFNDKISIQANFETMVQYLKDHFFNRPYMIKNNTIMFKEEGE